MVEVNYDKEGNYFLMPDFTWPESFSQRYTYFPLGMISDVDVFIHEFDNRDTKLNSKIRIKNALEGSYCCWTNPLGSCRITYSPGKA